MNRSIVSALFVLSVLTLACLAVGTARALDAGCKPVLDAAILQIRTPTHSYSTMTGSTNLSTETITTSDAHYMRVITTSSQWKKSSYSPQEEAQRAAENSGQESSCQHVGDESINGEAAAVYTEGNTDSGIRGKVWISKTRGLPLKIEMTNQQQAHFYPLRLQQRAAAGGSAVILQEQTDSPVNEEREVPM